MNVSSSELKIFRPDEQQQQQQQHGGGEQGGEGELQQGPALPALPQRVHQPETSHQPAAHAGMYLHHLHHLQHYDVYCRLKTSSAQSVATAAI